MVCQTTQTSLVTSLVRTIKAPQRDAETTACKCYLQFLKSGGTQILHLVLPDHQQR